MKIRVKLYASLAEYLPAHAADNQAELEVEAGTTPARIIAALGLPGEMCHLVLVNGVFVEPSARDSQPLEEGDALAIWPPVAGGQGSASVTVTPAKAGSSLSGNYGFPSVRE